MAAKKLEQYYGTGRRKTSVARVFLRKGTGAVVVNGKTLDDFFGRETSRMVVRQPLHLLAANDQFDVVATVAGGGASGQAGALRMGLTRALIHFEKVQNGNEDEAGGTGGGTWGKALRAAGYCTRDSREVERKKVGLHKARKSTQYSKR